MENEVNEKRFHRLGERLKGIDKMEARKYVLTLMDNDKTPGGTA